MILRGTVFSRALEMNTGLTVIAPGAEPEGAYKVVYVLHGLCGDSGSWTDFSMLPAYALEHRAFFVMPEAGRSFYADMTYGGKFFTYVADELPAICRRVFNVSARREDTAIIGGSMGGFGALKCALSRPERYGLCCAFASACLFLKDDLEKHQAQFRERYGEQLFRDFRAILGEDLAWRPDMEILELAKRAAAASERPRIYAACGADDPFQADNARMGEELRKLGFDLEYEEWPGGHDWAFFDEALRRGVVRMG